MALLVQLKLLGLTALVLTIIAACVLYMNYVVRFRSGLDNNEMLRRYWSKPDQVIFAPVFLPILLSWMVGAGVNSLVRSIIFALLRLMDALEQDNHVSLSGDYVVTVAGTVAGALVGTVVYIVNGGSILLLQILGYTCCALAPGLIRVVQDGSPFLIAVWVLSIVGAVVVSSLWISRGVSSKVRSSSIRDLIQRPLTPPTRRDKTNAVLIYCAVYALACSLCILQFALDHYIVKNGFTNQYFATVLHSFSRLMALVGVSVYAIIVVNSFIVLKRPLDMWQWFCAILSTNPLTIMITIQMFWPIENNEPKIPIKSLLIKVLFELYPPYIAVGYLSGAAYIAVLVRASSIALDPGVEGQSELILDDDEDEEYNIEA